MVNVFLISVGGWCNWTNGALDSQMLLSLNNIFPSAILSENSNPNSEFTCIVKARFTDRQLEQNLCYLGVTEELSGFKAFVDRQAVL